MSTEIVDAGGPEFLDWEVAEAERSRIWEPPRGRPQVLGVMSIVDDGGGRASEGVAARLRTARQSAGLSEMQLADALRTTPSEVVVVESALRPISLDAAARWALLTDSRLSWLLADTLGEVPHGITPVVWRERHRTAETVGQWVRAARLERDWDQVDLARHLGQSPALPGVDQCSDVGFVEEDIEAIESDEFLPVGLLVAAAHATGVDLVWLVDGIVARSDQSSEIDSRVFTQTRLGDLDQGTAFYGHRGGRVTVVRHDEYGQFIDETPLRHYAHHSPTGFGWGYLGSGPADLARCILIATLGDRARCASCAGTGRLASRYVEDVGTVNLAFDPDTDQVEHSWPCRECIAGFDVHPSMYHQFKAEVVAKLPEEFVLPVSEVWDWLEAGSDH